MLATQKVRVAKPIDNQCVMRSDPQRPKRFGSLKQLIINELCVATQVFKRSIYMVVFSGQFLGYRPTHLHPKN
jgi:hypothetical protein